MDRVQIKVEELFKSSPAMLFQFITDPACLVRWFCDEADQEGNLYSFTWNGATEEANLIDAIEDQSIRFQWVDAEDPREYLEFRMYKAGVTEQTVLEVSDFCDADDIKDSKSLWVTQLQQLRQEIGG